MTEAQQFQRWHDEDPIVGKCVHMLENIQDKIKRQTATYIMDEIINKPPYIDMLSEEIYSLATSEIKRRRWYDFDEIVRIFIELLRHAPAEARREIAITAICFIEDLAEQTHKSIEIKD